MDNTQNHNYSTPSEGTEDWHIPLNENFSQLEVDVEIRDKEINKDDYKPKKGSKYEAIDSGSIYYGDGSSWILADRKISSLSVNNIFTNSVIQLTYQKGGDGGGEFTGYADDIVSAVSEIGGEGGVVFITEEIDISSPIEHPQSGAYVGLTGLAGTHTPSIKATSSFPSGRAMFETGDMGLSPWGHIKSIEWNGDGNADRLLDIRGPGGQIIRSKCKNATQDGIYINKFSNKLLQSKVTSCGRNGIVNDGGNQLSLIQCDSGDHGDAGLRVQGQMATGPRIWHSEFHSNEHGIIFQDLIRNISVLGCQFENNNKSVISINPEVADNTGGIYGLWIAGTSIGTPGISAHNRFENIVIGPANTIWNGAEIDLNDSGGRNTVFCNHWEGSDQLSISQQDKITVIEPALGKFEFRAQSGTVGLGGSDLRHFAKYANDSEVPVDTMYYDTTDSRVEYKDESGEIHNLG